MITYLLELKIKVLEAVTVVEFIAGILTISAFLVHLFKVCFKIKYYVKYRGPILHVTSPALGSDDLSLDQSGMSIQILPEPNAVT